LICDVYRLFCPIHVRLLHTHFLHLLIS
jgi:hypothetical protein